jgi:hypothetical protein
VLTTIGADTAAAGPVGVVAVAAAGAVGVVAVVVQPPIAIPRVARPAAQALPGAGRRLRSIDAIVSWSVLALAIL